jgi:STE24 endopeptidase
MSAALFLFVAQTPAYTLPPDLLAKAQALQHLDTALYFGGTAWSLLTLGLLLRWRVGARMAQWAGQRTNRLGRLQPANGSALSQRPGLERLLQALMLAPLWLLLLAVVSLPVGMIGHLVSLHFGLSIESWPAWFRDEALSEGGTLLLGTLVLFVVFWLLRASPRLWWLWLWLLLQPCIVLGVYLSPVLVDPLFNHFTPLAQKDPELVGKLQHLAHLGGLQIPASRMFEEDASRRTNGMNAYVTGVGGSRRIVVWDTTVTKLPSDEILAIYAHEQGHYVLGHIAKGIAFSAALTFVLLAVLAAAAERLVQRFGNRWHIAALADWSALPLLLLLSTLLTFLSAPGANAFSRWEEHAADVYGQHLLAQVLPNAAQVEVADFNRLGRVWLEDPVPNRFVVWWTFTHPPVADRAEEARNCKGPTSRSR